jgi:hypothetical protein
MGILLSKGVDTQGVDENGNPITIPGKSIYIHGTDIELTSIYARLQFTANPDGRTIVASFKTYLNHDRFLADDELNTTVHSLNFDFVILETEVQSLEVALSYSAAKFVDLGYSAQII